MLHHAHVAHETKGRLRVKLPGARNKPELLGQIRKSLAGVPGVNTVAVNPLTGSILLHHDSPSPHGFREQLATFARQAELFALADPQPDEILELATDIRNESEYLATRSKTAELILQEVRKVNLGLKKATDNTLDLGVIGPLGAAVVTGVVIGLEAATPLWVTLAIFAFHSFVSMHPTPEKGAPGEAPQAAKQPPSP